MKIGGLIIEGTLFLAPMCNVTNLPFRLMCKRYGASVVYSEMINADAFVMESVKTKQRMFFLEEERPIALQMFGSNEEILVKAAKKIEKELKPDMIDINIGCPAYDVMKTGSGAALLNDLAKLTSLVHAISKSIKIPLTCKMRIKKTDEETIALAKAIESSGAKLLTVHGRTARQKYTGKANWNVIKKIKENLHIPVILNGDIKDEISAKSAFEKTGCDGLMIGRAAIGNPYLFKEINYYLATGQKLKKQAYGEKIGDFFEYAQLSKKYDYTSIQSIKMQAQNFTKGFEGSGKIRDKISKCKTIDEIISALGK